MSTKILVTFDNLHKKNLDKSFFWGRIKKMNYYRILGVNKSATKVEIRKAYLILAKQYHPDKFTDKKKAIEMQEKFTQIVKAYKILMEDNKRSEYDKTLQSASYKDKVENTPRTVQAKVAFKNGITFYRKGDFWRAERYFKSAVSLSEDMPLYKSYLGLSLAHQRKKRDEAIKYCKEAVNEELYNARFHVNLGIVYKLLDDGKNAIKCFKEALTWDGSNQRAIKELQSLGKTNKGKKGLFSRFFNKGE